MQLRSYRSNLSIQSVKTVSSFIHSEVLLIIFGPDLEAAVLLRAVTKEMSDTFTLYSNMSILSNTIKIKITKVVLGSYLIISHCYK